MSSKVRKIAIPSVKAGFIKNSFNPNDLLARPGLYTTYSTTEAYPILMAMSNTHLIENIATQYIDATTQQPIFKVNKKKLNGKVYKRNPDDDNEIFVAELEVAENIIQGEQAIQTYTGWEPIWWREAIQNSRDAGAKNIDCGSIQQEDEDGTWLIWFEDDGKGMDLETLRKAFLRLGGTAKKEDAKESVGGFGKAKEILILPWISYKIHTGTIIAFSNRDVRTQKQFYSYTLKNKYQKGVRLEVVMPKSNHTHIGWLLAFLSVCNTPGIKYTITGRFPTKPLTLKDTYYLGETKNLEVEVRTKTYRANLTTGKSEAVQFGNVEKPAIKEIYGSYIRTEANENGKVINTRINNTLLATIYIRPQPKNNPVQNQKLLVRDRGVYMFGLDVNPEFAKRFIAFVELEVPSKFVLTENRDSVRNKDLNDKIYAFLSEITKEGEDIFKKNKKLFFKKFYGEEGALAAQKRKRRKSELEAAELMMIAGSATVSKGTDGPELSISEKNIDDLIKMIDEYIKYTDQTNEDTISTTSGETTAQIIKGTKIRGAEQLNNILRQSTWKPNFAIKNENEGEQPAKKFFPDSMSPGVLKIAKYWTEFVRWTLAQLDVYREFNVGFIFTTDAQGMYVKEQNPETNEWEEWILINPIILEPGSGEWDYEKRKTENWISKGNLIKIRNEEHLRLMYAVAIHECTHMQSGLGDKDANFSVVLTYNIGKCAGFKEVRKLAKTIVTVSARKERESRPYSGKSIPTTQETGIFYVPSAGRGRPKVVKTFGTPKEIQFRYMWENKPADGWDGLACRLEIIVDNEEIFSGNANMGSMLSLMFRNWWDIRYGKADRINIIGFEVDLTSDGDMVLFNNSKTGAKGSVDIRSFLLVTQQMVEEVILKRINFIVSQSKDREARALRSEWKRVRG